MSPTGVLRPLVVDASVAFKWLVNEPGSDAALALKGRDLAATALLRVEVANALRTLAARKAATPAEVLLRLDVLQDVHLKIVPIDPALERRALEIALDLNHPIYDCVYLALAERTGHLLVTADARFLRVLRSTPHARHAASLEDVTGP